MRSDVAFLSVLAALVASAALLRYLPRKEPAKVLPPAPAHEASAPLLPAEAPPANVADRTPPLPIGAYYVGVYVESIDPALAAQLQLEGGLVVRHVVPGSPAESAGVQSNDLLLAGGGKPLHEVLTLGQVVNQAQEKEIEFDFLRAGAPLTIRMVPAQRPAEMWTPPVERNVAGDAPEGAGQWVYLSPAAEEARAEALKNLKLPDDFRLEIIADPDAQSPPHLILLVRANDKEYACQGLKLDALPSELRCAVETVLASRPAVGSPGEVAATIEALQRELAEARKELKRLKAEEESPGADDKEADKKVDKDGNKE